MAGKEIAVKKYAVRLSAEERETVRKRVCVTLRAHGGFEWKHSSSQQLNACAAIHGAL